MMGRSHALLGALGYASLYPLSQLDLPIQKEIILVAWVVPFVFTLAAPTPKKTKLSGMIKFIYGLLYWLAMVGTVLTAILLAAQYLEQFWPEVFPETPHERFIWMAVATGFAIVPDIDEPQSTIARVFGPVSRAFSGITRELAGGHRKGTHSWVFVLLGGSLAYLGTQVPIVAGIVISIAFIFAVRMTVPDKATGAAYVVMAIGFATAWLAVLGSVNLEPMIVAVIAGVLLHDLGDWMTNSGIPFWWPVQKKYSANFFSTGSDTETYFVRPLMTVGTGAVMIFWIFIPFTDWIQEEGTSGFFEDLPSISSQL